MRRRAEVAGRRWDPPGEGETFKMTLRGKFAFLNYFRGIYTMSCRRILL